MVEVMQAASQLTPRPQGGLPAPAPTGLEWRRSHGLVAYERAVAAMEARARALGEGQGSELVWLLQHPPLLTAGTSADPADLLDHGDVDSAIQVIDKAMADSSPEMAAILEVRMAELKRARNRKKRPLRIILILLVVAAAGGLLWWFVIRHHLQL